MKPTKNIQTITINARKYDLDIAAAQKAGVLTLQRKTITDFNLGDVFVAEGADAVVILYSSHYGDHNNAPLYQLGGCLQQALLPWRSTLMSRAETITYLNSTRRNFRGNIMNQAAKDLLK